MWAIIPARSGSKGFPAKNVTNLAGIPLLAHSINFAKKLSFIDKIILSTDSEDYAELGKKYGAEVPFLRSVEASLDTSMEEDILFDIKQQCKTKEIQSPREILWLRPTHPLRDVKTYERAYAKFQTRESTSICVVTEEDPRIFSTKDGLLNPMISNFEDRSMVRRQDCQPSYRIFGGEMFSFPQDYNRQFLGDRLGFEVAPKSCKFDIDYKEDLEYMDYILKTDFGKDLYGKFIHN